MALRRFTTVLSVLLGLGIIGIGLRFLLDQQGAASGFGVPAWPSGDAGAFLTIKGVRDIGTGLFVLAPLLLGLRRAAGYAMLAAAFIPFADMLIVFGYGGTAAAALGIHGLTAAVVIAAGVLLVREKAAVVRAG
ncbi:DUF4267 domain-containing protein [Longispora albida]|uniref:DUF4267 domain-containing protein n=1 Tax=Longispora albida TaxID=203523 RepID=UPI00036343E3|nr:DUF4267 domain-containing protein [Longispora albida]